MNNKKTIFKTFLLKFNVLENDFEEKKFSRTFFIFVCPTFVASETKTMSVYPELLNRPTKELQQKPFWVFGFRPNSTSFIIFDLYLMNFFLPHRSAVLQLLRIRPRLASGPHKVQVDIPRSKESPR